MKGQLIPMGNPGVRELSRPLMCGLCHQVGAEYGFRYRMFAGPDMMFLAAWLHLVRGERPSQSRRSCVLGPGVTRLPTQEATETGSIAAAVGIWMGWAKIDDDARDEDSLLKRLAARTFHGGSEQARASLERLGFPVDEIEAWMDRQEAIEASEEPVAFVDALVPTMEIARRMFSFGVDGTAGVSAEEAGTVGAQIGRYLCALDNLEDYEEDAAAGQYNALAQAYGAPAAVPAAGRTVALAEAEDAVDRIERVLEGLADSPWLSYVRSTLICRFRRRLHVHQGIAAPIVAPSWAGRVWANVAREAGQVWLNVNHRVRMVMALSLSWANPAWAAGWWPEEATPETLGLTPGFQFAGTTDTPTGDTGTGDGGGGGGGGGGGLSCDPLSGACDGIGCGGCGDCGGCGSGGCGNGCGGGGCDGGC